VSVNYGSASGFLSQWTLRIQTYFFGLYS
jgi:hypothetical protein